MTTFLTIIRRPGVNNSGTTHATVLKACSEELSIPLGNMFTNSLRSGVSPDPWETAPGGLQGTGRPSIGHRPGQASDAQTNFKKGYKSLSSYYRPNSMTLTLARLVKAITANSVRSQLGKKKKVSFMSRRMASVEDVRVGHLYSLLLSSRW